MSLASDQYILEGVMTTLGTSASGASMLNRVNIAPMGPIVDQSMSELLLRPFKTSTTYQNLKANGEGIFHVTDDVLLMARAAIETLSLADGPAVRPAEHVEGLVLAGACRYYELRVIEMDDRDDRTAIRACVVAQKRLRDFFGLNRAKHAVLEAAILATRLHLTGAEPVMVEYERFQTMVDKTGGQDEHKAMAELQAYVQSWRPSGQMTRTSG